MFIKYRIKKIQKCINLTLFKKRFYKNTLLHLIRELLNLDVESGDKLLNGGRF